ncbi:MAG: gephyrin-like molybdotransferase Glp [Halorientalis sp.]
MPTPRESGFKDLTPLPAARERLLAAVTPHERTETVPLSMAEARTVAETVRAGRAVPHYDRAAMDGYAVRAADTVGAGDRSPALLRLGGGAGEGDPPEVGPDEAVPVHTGSELPPGADAVVKVEQCDVEPSSGGTSAPEDADPPTEVTVFDAVAPGENVAAAGEDVEAGQSLFEPGHRLRPSDLGLLKATGADEVTCYQPPTVGVVPTGEELVQRDPRPGEVVETNGLTVAQYVERWGGTATYRDVVTDDPNALRAAIQRDLTKDVVVTTGGSSVGERDRLPEVVADLGEVAVHGVGVKPGHPFGFGVVQDTPVLMLPGYPVACIVAAVQFLRPALKRAGHVPRSAMPTTPAVLDRKLPSEPGVRTFARVRLDDDSPAAEGDAHEGTDRGTGDLPAAEPTRASGAGALSSVAMADGWVVVPEAREGIPAGERVAVQHWEWEP